MRVATAKLVRNRLVQAMTWRAAWRAAMVAGVLIVAPALAAQDDARGKWQVSTSRSRGAADFRITLETRGDRSIQAACGSANPGT